MPKRIFMWVLILVVAGAVIYLLVLQQPNKLKKTQTAKDVLPLEVQRLIPPAWNLNVEGSQQCDFDGDNLDEWLVMYRYDSVELLRPDQPKGPQVGRGLIGAVIYDARLDSQEQGNPGQYPSTSITPYRLLPDFTDGKGQGYLGESKVTPILIPPLKDGKCQPDEIAFLGYSDGDQVLPTRLSIFRRPGDGVGYRVAHFVGNARVSTLEPLDGLQPITQVTTYSRLDDRSLLCKSRTFQRDISQSDVSFTENPDLFTVDYCFGVPLDPMYPEGAVVAFLRASQPNKAGDKPPLGDSYLRPGVGAPGGLQKPSPIRLIEHRAAANLTPSGGHPCTDEKGNNIANWLCGQQEAIVTTEIPVAGVYQLVTWRLISVARADVVDDVHWRIAQVTVP